MSKHTKEPWRAIEYIDPQWQIHGSTGEFHVIALTAQGNDEANAKRIVACVNACAGINPDAVKDLLQACKLARQLLTPRESWSDQLAMDVWGAVLDAIAKAERETP